MQHTMLVFQLKSKFQRSCNNTFDENTDTCQTFQKLMITGWLGLYSPRYLVWRFQSLTSMSWRPARSSCIIIVTHTTDIATAARQNSWTASTEQSNWHNQTESCVNVIETGILEISLNYGARAQTTEKKYSCSMYSKNSSMKAAATSDRLITLENSYS